MRELFFIIIFISIIFLISQYCLKYCGTAVHNKGYGSMTEPLNMLIDRIDWSNHYKGRDNIQLRYIIYSLIITFFILSVTENKLPSIISYIRGIFIMFILLRSFHYYFDYHSEKFSHYAIDRNLKIIRKKLNIRKNKVSVSKYKKFPGASACWNFKYRTEY